MARIALTEELANRILEVPKIIEGDITWHADPDQNYYKSVTVARSDLRIPLKVHINVNKTDRSKVSVTLVVSGAYPILRLDVTIAAGWASMVNEDQGGERTSGAEAL